MNDNDEYDALGELFRQRLENHQIPVAMNGWNTIEQRMAKPKTKTTIWWWSGIAAAAAVAALLIIVIPDDANIDPAPNDETTPTTPARHAELVSASPTNEDTAAQASNDETDPVHNAEPAPVRHAEPTPARHAELVSASPTNEAITVQASNDETEPAPNDETTPTPPPARHAELVSASPANEAIAAQARNNETDPAPNDETTPTPPARHAELVSASPANEENAVQARNDEPATVEKDKLLFTAAFGTGAAKISANDISATPNFNSSPKSGLSGSDNLYASNLSNNVRSFSNMSRDDFKKIDHRPPLSFGVTVRKLKTKSFSIESGLIYTCLSSHFEFPAHEASQTLHYLGIPLNFAKDLNNSNPVWRFYISTGFTVEKGLRAIYNQDRHLEYEIRNTTVRSSIKGLQWSLNGAVGVRRRLEKGFGVYFEPRIGYSFQCNQPVSIRTEYPLYFGINLGINYEIQ